MAQIPLDKDLNIVAQSDIQITIDPLTKNLNIIQALDDEPNDVGGLSAQQLKEKFDEAGNAIKTYINETLVPQCLSEGVVENQRKANEAQRQANETARQSAEQLRANAEALREQAEQMRAEAEALRESVFLESQEAREQVFADSQTNRESQFTDAQTDQEERFLQAEEDRNAWEEYDPAKDYHPGNKVYYLGSSYVCRYPCGGIAPEDARYWQIIAKRGLDGEGATPYSYAKEGGYTGTDDDFRAAMASAPWLPLSGGTVVGTVQIGANIMKSDSDAGKLVLRGIDKTSQSVSTSGASYGAIDVEIVPKNELLGHLQSNGSGIWSTTDCLDITTLIKCNGLHAGAHSIGGVGGPVYLDDAATKGYVDDAVAGAISHADAAGVTSFKGRKGAVTPASGDYTAAQVGAYTQTQCISASTRTKLGLASTATPDAALSALASLAGGKMEFVTVASGMNGTLSNMTRTYNVNGWSAYSIICVDIGAPSGYNYTVKCNGQSGAFWTGNGVEYGRGICYIHGGVRTRLIFFPMRDASATVSCLELCTMPGFGFISGLNYSTLSTLEIAPEGAVAFGSAIPVTITALK